MDNQFSYRLIQNDTDLQLEISKPKSLIAINSPCTVFVSQMDVQQDSLSWPIAQTQVLIDLPEQSIYGLSASTICYTGNSQVEVKSNWAAANRSLSAADPFQFKVNGEIRSQSTLPAGKAIDFYFMGDRVTGARLDYFGHDYRFPIAPPVLRNPEPMSTEVIATETINESFNFPVSGRYRINHNGQSKDLLVVEEDFPKLTTSEDLAWTLRFITKNEEFQKVTESEKVKTAIDLFWLDIGGSEERCRVLIKEFYGRVERANVFFTENKPGWLSDRGMLYIVYGQPDRVVQENGKEVWEYIDFLDDSFSFTFTEKDGAMSFKRDREYAETWNLAVYKWRNGIISKLSL